MASAISLLKEGPKDEKTEKLFQEGGRITTVKFDIKTATVKEEVQLSQRYVKTLSHNHVRNCNSSMCCLKWFWFVLFFSFILIFVLFCCTWNCFVES